MSTGPEATQAEAHATTPTLFWWLIAYGIGALVLHGLLQDSYVSSGPSGGFQLVALTVIGGVAGPLLIAGLVGVVLHRLGFRHEE